MKFWKKQIKETGSLRVLGRPNAQDFRAICFALKANPVKELMQFCCCGFTNEDIFRLFSDPDISPQFKKLELEYNQISQLDHLCDLLQRNPFLEYLSLHGNQVDSWGVLHITKLLDPQSTTLKFLDLSHNFVNDQGALHLSQGLHQNRTLKVLKLNENDIGDAGAIALAYSLSSNMVIENLELCSNRIGNLGIITLIRQLCNNISTLFVHIRKNPGWTHHMNEVYQKAVQHQIIIQKILVFYLFP